MPAKKPLIQSVDELTQSLALEIRHYSVLSDVGWGADKSVQNVFFYSLITELVKMNILDSLSNIPDTVQSQKEMYEIAQYNFKVTKTELQNCFAKGFERAMGMYSGMNTSYYCQVKPVPPSINKDPI